MRKLIALCLTTVLLAGCSAGTKAPAGPAPKATDKPVELTLHVAFGSQREALDDAIEVYENKHPNTKIRVRELPMQQMMTKDGAMNTAVIEEGDLVLLPEGQALSLWNAGKLRDLSSVRAPQLGELAAPLFDELGKADGKRYGLPVAITPGMLMYNADAFAKAGVKVPTVDWTVQEFEQTLGALKAAGATYNLTSGLLIEPIVRAYGGQMYDPARQAWAFDTPEAKAGLGLMGRLTKAGIIEVEGGAKVRVMIGNGPGAPTLTALPLNLNVQMPGMTFLPYPKGPGGRSVPASAQVGGVLSTSANPEAATDFLKELISDPTMQMALAKGGVRPLINDSKALAAWTEAVGDQTARATELSLQDAYVGSQVPALAEALTGLEPFFKGTATLEEIVPGLIARLK